MIDKKVSNSYNNLDAYKKKARNISTEIYKINVNLYKGEERLESASFKRHRTSTKLQIDEKYREFNLDFD